MNVLRNIKKPFVNNDFDDLIQEIKCKYKGAQDVAKYWMRKYNEYNKEEEVKRLNEEIERLNRLSLHIFSEKEAKADHDFRNEHYERHYTGTKGSCNTYIYALTGTGIGNAISIKCPICGESKDITDIDSW